MNQTFTDNYEDLVEFKSQMIALMYREGRNERGGELLEDLRVQYRRDDNQPVQVYEAVKARVAELLR